MTNHRTIITIIMLHNALWVSCAFALLAREKWTERECGVLRMINSLAIAWDSRPNQLAKPWLCSMNKFIAFYSSIDCNSVSRKYIRGNGMRMNTMYALNWPNRECQWLMSSIRNGKQCIRVFAFANAKRGITKPTNRSVRRIIRWRWRICTVW